MNIRLPIVLITFGLGFLLYNLKLISFTPWDILWPALIIWLGASQLLQIIKKKRGTEDSWEIALWLFVLTIGIYILLPNIGVATPAIPWKIVWPLILITFGILTLLPGKCNFIKVDLQPEGNRQSGDYKSSFIGEINRGPNSWVLDDLYIRHGIGSVKLDLTQAIIPDRETNIDVYGYIGEVAIYLPPGLPFKADCVLNVGEVTVIDHNESGPQKHIKTQSVDFDTATRKVNITIHWKIGEIRIHQIR